MRMRTVGAGLLAASAAVVAAAGPASGAGPLVPQQRLCFAVAGAPGDVAVVNLTPVLAKGPGSGLLVSSDIAQPPVASNVNFGPGTVDPNVAFAPIGPDGQVCFVNSNNSQVDLAADHLGTIAIESFTPARPDGTPKRTVDTRIGAGGTAVAPGARVCFDVAGATGDVAVVNLTPVVANGPGSGLLVSSDIAQPPVASNVNFGPGTVDPNVAFAPIGRDGRVCFVNSNHSQVDLIADHLGTIAIESYTPANADATPKRTVDTRVATGGTTLRPGARVCFTVAGATGDVAVVNLTPVVANGPGFGLLVSSDIAQPPVASNVNFGPGSIDPNVAFAPIGRDGRVCFVNSNNSQVDLVADHLGTIAIESFTPANADATPKRTVDTRDWRPAVYLNFHGSEQLLGATDARWPFVRANLDGFWGHWSSAPDLETQTRNTIELTRKVAGRKLVYEHPIALPDRSCGSFLEDYFYAGVPGVPGTGVEGRAPDIRYDRVAMALYAGDNPNCWGTLGGYSTMLAKFRGQAYDEVWALYQASNLVDNGEPQNGTFPLIAPGSSGDVAYRNAGAVVIECQMDDCLHDSVREQFFRVIADTHARGQSFVWFTGYYIESGIGSSGWLAKIQRTYNAIADRGLWRPGDAVTIINYYGAYPALPERNPDGTAADTVTGVVAWLLEQRPAR
jgi:hypothetical protein